MVAKGRMAKYRMAKERMAKERMSKDRIAKERMAKERMAKDRIHTSSYFCWRGCFSSAHYVEGLPCWKITYCMRKKKRQR